MECSLFYFLYIWDGTFGGTDEGSQEDIVQVQVFKENKKKYA